MVIDLDVSATSHTQQTVIHLHSQVSTDFSISIATLQYNNQTKMKGNVKIKTKRTKNRGCLKMAEL